MNFFFKLIQLVMIILRFRLRSDTVVYMLKEHMRMKRIVQTCTLHL